MSTGLVPAGLRTITEFTAAGVKLSAVNLMAMGTAAISAAKAFVAATK